MKNMCLMNGLRARTIRLFSLIAPVGQDCDTSVDVSCWMSLFGGLTCNSCQGTGQQEIAEYPGKV
jgi:hypothetical protein